VIGISRKEGIGKFKETIASIKELLPLSGFLYRSYENYEFARRLNAPQNKSQQSGVCINVAENNVCDTPDSPSLFEVRVGSSSEV
jgi:hypothetical protein